MKNQLLEFLGLHGMQLLRVVSVEKVKEEKSKEEELTKEDVK